MNFKQIVALAFALIPIVQTTKAQNLATLQFKIDSLNKNIARHPREDTTRARLIINAGRKMSNSREYDKAVAYFRQAMVLSQKIRWPLGVCYINRCLAVTNNNNKDYDNAIIYANQTIALADKAGIDSVKYDGHFQLGNTYANQKKYTEAIKELLLAADYGKKAKNRRLAVSPLYTIGNTYYNLNDEKNADLYFRKALNESAALNNRVDKIKLYSQIAYRYSAHNNYQKAFELLMEQQPLFLPNEATPDHLDAMDFIGSYYYSFQKQPQTALPYFLKSLQIKEKLGVPRNIALSYTDIGGIYSTIRDGEKAEEYFLKAEKIFSKLELPANIKDRYISLLLQLGLTEYYLGKFDAGELYLKKIPATNGTISNALVDAYIHIVKATKANKNKLFAVSIEELQKIDFSKFNDPNAQAGYDVAYGDLLVNAPDSTLVSHHIPLQSRREQGTALIKKGAEILAANFGKDAAVDAYQALSSAYEKAGDYKNAYGAYQNYIAARDSVSLTYNEKEIREKFGQFTFAKKEDSLKFQQQLISEKLKQQTLLSTKQEQDLLINRQQLTLANRAKDLEKLKYLKTQAGLQAEQNARKANMQQLKATQKERELANTTVQLQKSEIKAKKTQSYYLIGGIAALLGLSFFIAQNYNNQRKSNKQIQAEKQRSEALLLNILPEDVAEELKEKGSAEARLFEEVTVLFTDFVNFTTITQLLTPQQLVDELHACFMAFDHIVAKYDIEKIKTIGDAYLAVSGLPNPIANHAENAVNAAIEIAAFIKNRKAQLGDKTFDIRVGIHSGSVVAGIVGVKKFAYDIWGDTVNTAARMEQNSEPGKVNMSENTYELVKDKFNLTYRGEIEAKNKGKLKMYFVN